MNWKDEIVKNNPTPYTGDLNTTTMKTFYTGRPFYLISCDHFGYIENAVSHKAVQVLEDGTVMTPDSYSYEESIANLHQWLKKNVGEWTEKVKFEIHRVDGSIGKWDDIKLEKVYSITAAKAEKLLS